MEKVGVQQREGVTILAPRGKITIGEGDIALRDAVNSALDNGSRKILINLSGVPNFEGAMDSSGIGELVSAYTNITNAGGKLALVRMPGIVTDILQITQLVTYFDIYNDVDSAIEALTGSDSPPSDLRENDEEIPHGRGRWVPLRPRTPRD